MSVEIVFQITKCLASFLHIFITKSLTALESVSHLILLHPHHAEQCDLSNSLNGTFPLLLFLFIQCLLVIALPNIILRLTP